MIYVAVDLGIRHLAVVRVMHDYRHAPVTAAAWPEGASVLEIMFTDLMEHSHNGNTLQGRTKTWFDLDATRRIFGHADVVLLERQPPGGGGGTVQELLHMLLLGIGARVELVHPRSVHAVFGDTPHDYDSRKIRAEARTKPGLTPEQKGLVGDLVRAHDVADAMQMVWYHLYSNRPAPEPPPVDPRVVNSLEKFSEFCNQFRFEEPAAAAQ